jgi:SpoVK/Ycf46/Vps4 family AAA+-type ATPase
LIILSHAAHSPPAGQNKRATEAMASSSLPPPTIHLHGDSKGKTILKIASIVGSLFGAIIFYKALQHAAAAATAPSTESVKKAHKANEKLADKLKRAPRPAVTPIADDYELRVLADVVFPDQIHTSMAHIAGLKTIKDTIRETVIVPLQNPHLFASTAASAAGGANDGSGTQGGTDANSSGSVGERKTSDRPVAAPAAPAAPADLLQLEPPKGVLFYGPPGTGKTLMARAIAKDCNATFIEVKASTIQNKYFGESPKLISAIFSVARKFAPSIIFIDEVDLLLGAGGSAGGSVSDMYLAHLRGDFMTHWDGLLTEDTKTSQVTVIGATNRPYDIDEAVQRRFTAHILFSLPDAAERKAMLTAFLQPHLANLRVSVGDDEGAVVAAMDKLVDETNTYSGSDLFELCKYACALPLRELIRKHCASSASTVASNATATTADGSSDDSSVATTITEKPRALQFSDLTEALHHVKPVGVRSSAYHLAARRAALGRMV